MKNHACEKTGESMRVKSSTINEYLKRYYAEAEATGVLSSELTRELGARCHPVQREIERYLADGGDLNEGEDDFPLMQAVKNADAPMTAFLLRHGANPFYDLLEDGKPFGCGNWYVDQLDFLALRASFRTNGASPFYGAILRTANLLANSGVCGTGSYCLELADKKVRLTPARLRIGAGL